MLRIKKVQYLISVALIHLQNPTLLVSSVADGQDCAKLYSESMYSRCKNCTDLAKKWHLQAIFLRMCSNKMNENEKVSKQGEIVGCCDEYKE